MGSATIGLRETFIGFELGLFTGAGSVKRIGFLDTGLFCVVEGRITTSSWVIGFRETGLETEFGLDSKRIKGFRVFNWDVMFNLLSKINQETIYLFFFEK